MKKRLFTLFLALALSLSLAPNALAARIQLGNAGTKKNIAIMDSNSMQPIQIYADTSVGIYLKTAERLMSVSVVCPSFDDSIGSLTFRLYQWKDSYAVTTTQKPIVTKTYTDFVDGSSLAVILPIDQVYTGEFLLTIGDGVQSVGVWTDKNNPVITSDVPYKCFLNGKEMSGAIRSTCVTLPLNETADNNDVKVKDAYSRISVNDADKVEGGWFSEIDDGYGTGELAPYVGGIQTGSYIYFGKVDFGKTSPKGVRMRVYNQGCYSNIGETQIVLDKLQGYPIAKMTVMLEQAEEREWETTTDVIEENITGVHDVYMIFRGSEFAPSWIEFTKETPEISRTDKRLQDFLATPAISPVEHYEDTWAASDILGRKLPDNAEVGDPRENKQVGLFYHNWRSVFTRTASFPYDVTKILNSYDGDPADIKNDLKYPYWGAVGNVHFWNESIYGYYCGYDEWVMRKHLELFAAADIDAIIFDNTNSNLTFSYGFMAMGKLIHQMKTEGIDAPQMSFMTPFAANNATAEDIRLFYDNMYSLGLYSDAWFYWDGKPLIMGYPDSFKNETGYEDIDKQSREILDYFTFRPVQPNYWAGQRMENQWSWAEVAPQHGFVQEADGSYEMASVSTAQNTNDTTAKGTYSAMNGDGIFGRSYTYANKHAMLDEKSCYMGYNFQEQWDNALDIDPQFIFITGWNEGMANRFSEHAGVVGAIVDSYNNEYSRDIEPIKSDFKDTYYIQMANNIRRFKGVQKAPEAGEKVSIDINGSFNQWDNVDLTYYDYAGLPDRDALKLGRSERYVNYTGRNDFTKAKAARDNDNLYFYIETAEDITPYTDNAWMRLFLNIDRLMATGWEGYDFALNIESPSASKAILSKSTGFWQWENVAEVDYKVEGNRMMVVIPRETVGLKGVGNLDFEFKWADNMQTYGNLMEDFYTNGDVAPIARYNYRFVENAAKSPTKQNEEFIYPEDNVFDKARHFTVLKLDTPFALTAEGATPIDSTNDAVTPILLNGRTFVPIRFVTERLGASKIEWNEESKTATIYYFQKRILITEGSNTIKVEKDKIAMDVAAFTMNDRMYIPLRAVSEAFRNVEIYWEDPCYVFVGNKYTDQYMNDSDIRWYMSKYFG